MPNTRLGHAATVLCIAALAACQSLPKAVAPEPSPSKPAAAPAARELASARYQGIEEAGRPVTLQDGRWEGQPLQEGGASRPAVTLARDFRLTGDLDGDGREEAAVLLAGNAGGSGETVYLAIVGRRGPELRNIATAALGDRVQVRAGRIERRRVWLDVVQAGKDDALCCPGDLVSRSWELVNGRLKEGEPALTGRLAPAALSGSQWVLRAWAWDEPAAAEPAVTLRFEGARTGGNAGCNNYSTTLAPGDMPGDVKPGPVIATRRMCPEPEMGVEDRFLRQLEAVRQMRFIGGRLALVYDLPGASGVMLFEQRPAPEP